MRTLLKVLIGGLLALPLMAHAAEKKKAAPAPAPAKKEAPPPAPVKSRIPMLSEVLEASGITLSGTIDASWDWSDVDGGPNGAGTQFVNLTPTHAFDVSQNAFSLHQVNLTVARQPSEGVGFLVNVIGGDDAGIIGGKQADIDVTQGFISYATGPVTVIGGRYVTLAGYEVINPAGNLNASRGLLFTLMQPLTHTGVRATAKFGDALSFTAGVNNSAGITDYGAMGPLGVLTSGGSLKNENNTSKTLEAQIGVTPDKALSGYLTLYRGEEETNFGGHQTKQLLDLVVSSNLLDMLTLGLNADYLTVDSPDGFDIGTQEVYGVAGYVGASAGPFRVAVRGEYMDVDIPNVFGGGVVTHFFIREFTLTTGYKVASNLELLAEVRQDQTQDNNGSIGYAPRDAGFAGTGQNDDMYTATIKGILTF